MITYENVAVRYHAGASDTVRDVSFEALPGRVTALVGPNGSGKSTLVRALLRRVPRVHGDIRVGGTSVDTLSRRDFARTVAVVTQREETTFARPVREYIALGRHPHRGAWGGDGDVGEAEAVRTAAARAEVDGFLDRRTDELSGGEWQRVRLARALAQLATPDDVLGTANAQRALVLDEPTTFLDVAHEMATFELLDGLARGGIAVLLVSHQLNLVARFAQHIVLLHGGRIAASGTPDAVMRGDVLEAVYGWPLVVVRDPAVNAPALVPLRQRG